MKGLCLQHPGLENLSEPQDDEGCAVPQCRATGIQVTRHGRRVCCIQAATLLAGSAQTACLPTGCTRHLWAWQIYQVSAVSLSNASVTIQLCLCNRTESAACTAPLLGVCAAVAGGAVCIWLAQEWAIHAKLLHSQWSWFGGPLVPLVCPWQSPFAKHHASTQMPWRGGTGKDLHEQHHDTQYFHICVDGVELVAPVMLLALAAFSVAFHSAPALGHTAALSYWAAGLGYLWTHYFVHLPVATSSRWAKAVRRHHMLCVPLCAATWFL